MTSIEDIKAERQKKGLSQWALAIRVGRTGSWLGLRETGYVQAKPEEIAALSEALEGRECKPIECRVVGG